MEWAGTVVGIEAFGLVAYLMYFYQQHKKLPKVRNPFYVDETQ